MEETRIEQLRLYLINILDSLLTTDISNVNANNLDIKIGSYSIDKIPNNSVVENWITGVKQCQDTFLFRSRNSYSQDTINNLKNIGFFEKFEKKINDNNRKGILPNIEDVEEIKCLNCGSLNSVNDNTAEFNIQIQIVYRLK